MVYVGFSMYLYKHVITLNERNDAKAKMNRLFVVRLKISNLFMTHTAAPYSMRISAE